MRFIFLPLLLLAACSTQPKRQLRSPFPSTVEGVSIPNAHVVSDKKGLLLRGMMPTTDAEVKSLVDKGINEILIFRNSGQGELAVESELALLSRQPSISSVHVIPFQWKDIDPQLACIQTLQALKILASASQSKGSGLYYHCTVGEDRTGYLTAMYKVLFEKKSSDKAFKEDMCGHGYAEADPHKPTHVTQKVHENLTVLYLKMQKLVKSGKLSAKKLDQEVCKDPIIRSTEFTGQVSNYRCK